MWSYQAYDVVQTQSPIFTAIIFANLSLICLGMSILWRNMRKLREDSDKPNNITIQNPLKAPPRPRKHLPSEITCPKCRKTSHNPNDITNNYCGNCHWWTSDPHLAGINPDDLAKNLRVDPLPKRPRKKGTPR